MVSIRRSSPRSSIISLSDKETQYESSPLHPMLRLPLEILRLISQLCSFEDVSNFRKTCKRVNEACLDTFKKSLKTHCVALDERSIQNLIDIAKHEVFGSCVKHLVISTAHLPESRCKAIAPSHSAQYTRLREAQRRFVNSGLALEKLREAARELVGCVSITLTDTDHDIPRGITRMLANEFALEPQNGGDILSVYEDQKFMEYALHAILAAFTASSHAKDLSIDVGEPCLCFDDSSLQDYHDCDPDNRGLSLDLIMRSMRTVQLCDTFCRKRNPTSLKLVLDTPSAGPDPLNTVVNPNITHGLEIYLSRCNISHLNLSCNEPDLTGILSRLAEFTFPELRTLKLRGMAGKRQDIIRLLENHKGSLEQAEFRNIGLTRPDGWEVLRKPETFKAPCHVKISVCYDLPDLVEIFSADHTC